MNAPSPPPTMPRRSRRAVPPWRELSIATSGAQAEHAPVRGLVGAGSREIVERALGDIDDVACDERRALASTLLRALDAALPLEHRPAVVVVLRQLGED